MRVRTRRPGWPTAPPEGGLFLPSHHTSLAAVQSPESELPGKDAVAETRGHCRNFRVGSWPLIRGFPWELLCWRKNAGRPRFQSKPCHAPSGGKATHILAASVSTPVHEG